MWDFEIGHALALMGRTLPFILLRIAVYATIAIAYVLATGLGAALGWAIGGVGGPGGQGVGRLLGRGHRLRRRGGGSLLAEGLYPLRRGSGKRRSI